MPNLPSSKNDSTSPVRYNLLRSAWGWLTKPLDSHLTASGRRSRLLAWVLLCILLLTLLAMILVFIADPPGSARRAAYIPLILGLSALVVIAYLLNRAGNYPLAASLVVVAALLAPWASALLDPEIPRGDFVPLTYTVVSVLLSSILLTPFITAALAGAQLLALALVAFANPATAPINWPSFLGFIFITSMLCILSAAISEQDLNEIDRQTQQLAQSAAEQRELSVRDHLTRLFNRRYLEESLAREIRRSVRSRRSIGIILFDVDQFKQVNDKWGHAAGDALLIQIGELATSHIRGGDIACRYGGDEFVLVLPEASRQTTRLRAVRFAKVLRNLQLQHGGGKIGNITISAGVAIYPEHGTSGEALLRSADKALYRAKDGGRDRVVVAGKTS